MRNEKYAKAPLLYIDNGKPPEVRATMQHQYRSKKSITTASGEKVYEGKTKKRLQNFYELSEEMQQHETEENIEKKAENTTDKKPFTKMTTQEKLIYLTTKPDYAPKISCSVRTSERIYRGIILEYKDGTVKMRSGRRNVGIKEKDIKDIKMMSL